jgi:hypothetical protein
VSTSSAYLPGPRGVDVVRTLLALRRDPLAAFQHAADTYGDVVRFPFGRRAFVLVAHADGVRHVLQDNAHRHSKRTRSYRQVATLLGDGLVTSNGERWRRQRRAAQPMFARRQVARLDGVVVRAAEVMVDRRRDSARREEPVDLGAELVQLTLGVVITSVSLYVGAMILLFFRPERFELLLAGFALEGYVYGCYGLLVGTIVRRELEGILLVVLLANIGVGWLQNPLFYAEAQNQVIIRALPAFFPSQVSMIAAFTDHAVTRPLLGGFAYGTVLLALATLLYWLRMRTHR